MDQVGEIIWQYKLSPDTLNLAPTLEVKEIQIFSIALRVANLKDNILRTLDRSIPSHLFFQLYFQGRVRFAAAYKRMSETDKEKQVTADYYWTKWQDAAAPCLPLPVTTNMGGLYEQMLQQHMLAAGLTPRPKEKLAESAERGSRIRAQEVACKRLEARLRREAQFNRKVEINAALRQCRAELVALEKSGNTSGGVL